MLGHSDFVRADYGAIPSSVFGVMGRPYTPYTWVGILIVFPLAYYFELIWSISMVSFVRVLSVAVVLILCLFYGFAHFILSGNTTPADPKSYYRGPFPEYLHGNAIDNEPAELPLSTKGRNIVDAKGTRVKLSSVNWYGASDGGMIPMGLDVQHRNTIARTIRRLGFNSVRLPYADEMVVTNPLIDDDLLLANPDLRGLTALDIFAAVVRALTEAGLYVVINDHITQARWCCDANVCDGLWKNDHWGPLCRIRQTEEDWIRNLETVVRPHINDKRVIGVDLRNEVRGLTDKLLWDSWATAAERASARLHALQPDWLMFVEGVSSANDVSGAAHRPVQLTVPNKLVYSAHIYGWSGWGSLSPFWGRNYDSFVQEMRFNWAFLLEQDIAPVWIGEIGGPHYPNKGDMNYWDHTIRFLKEMDVDFAYWAINPRKWDRNVRETYALVRDDWVTPILDYRLYDMLSLMRR